MPQACDIAKDRLKHTDAYMRWQDDFVHLVSLMHALAIMSLRCDTELSNLSTCVPADR